MEAIFESIPQSVLQLVFIIRTGAQFENQSNTIFIVSILLIIQSIISITNSILRNDNTNDITKMQEVLKKIVANNFISKACNTPIIRGYFSYCFLSIILDSM